MAIPLKERLKIGQLMARIESGEFDANDVDAVLIKLRPYSGQRKVFREITDFVAHADARNKGVTCDSMTAFADAMRFFIEYTTGKKALDVSQPFPSYIYRLFLSQARQSNEEHLKSVYKLSHATLIKKIEGNFTVNKAAQTCTIRPEKAGKEFLAALQYVVGFIHSKPAFHVNDFHAQFREVLQAEGVLFDGARLEAQSDRISLAILCLVSGTEIVLPEGHKAKCTLECENHFRILVGQRRLPTGEVTVEPGSFGNLQIQAEITIISNGAPPLRVAYPVIDTNLDPRVHCDEVLFATAQEQNEFGDYSIQVINFSPDMALSNGFKLIRADATDGNANAQ